MAGVLRAALKFKDVLDTATDEEYRRGEELVRDALRRRDWVYLPKTTRKWPWTEAGRAELERHLKLYGDKSTHSPPKREQHLQYPPKKFGPRSK